MEVFKIYPTLISNKNQESLEKIKYKMSQKLLQEEKYDSSIVRTAEEFLNLVKRIIKNSLEIRKM